MRYIADLHIHSHFSIATSGECDPLHLFEAAARKGVNLVGTGDFTHPGWRGELKESLEPDDGSGLFRLKPELENQARRRLPGPVRDAVVRFALSSEISSIYKKGGRARKVHNLILMPSIEAATALSNRLERIGNIRSDGRPILGLDCRELLAMSLESDPGCCFIPAHIWTPHFSVFGSKSGFDRMEDCYGDLTEAIYAVETGLSSDPPMNWRLSALDRFALVSNSDAHSPDKLVREANLLDSELSWEGLTGALRSRDPKRFIGTLEFFPEEGKYHYDGHRACGVRLHPDESAALGGRCPVCRGKLTGGVYGRVAELADRPDGARPACARQFERLVPLREILAEVLDAGPSTKRTESLLERVIAGLGSELDVLRSVPLEDITRVAGPLAAEAVRRTRAEELSIDPGYDGEFGTVRIFGPGEREHGAGQIFLPGSQEASATNVTKRPEQKTGDAFKIDIPEKRTLTATAEPVLPDPLALLDGRQREAVIFRGAGPLAVAAGPGTGKTRCLAGRVLHLIRELNVSPARIAAITFTNRAAAEMRSRIENMAAGRMTAATLPFTGTFHSWCLDRLTRILGHVPAVLDENERLDLIRECLEPGGRARTAQMAETISLAAACLESPDSYRGPESVRVVWTAYRALCNRLGVLDFDSLITETVNRLSLDSQELEKARLETSWLLVDEFQDVNPAQYALVRLLAGPSGEGLFVIGDPNQSIYAFRGATPDVFDRLRADYPEARIMNLETNYRCCPAVSRASAALIVAGGSPWRAPESAGGPETQVWRMRCTSETAEAIAVVREASRLAGGASMLEAHGQGRAGRAAEGDTDDCGYSFGDMLVVARTAALLEEMERAFVVEGFPCRVRGSRAFLSDREVQGLLAVLRLTVVPQDDFHFRIASRLTGLDPESEYYSLVSRSAEEHNRPLLAELKSHISREVPLSRTGEKAARFLVLMDRCRRDIDRLPPAALLESLAGEIFPKRESHPEPLKQLLNVALEFSFSRDFLRRVSLQAEGDLERNSGRPAAEAVTLSTMHAAKGLEFPVVFVCALEEGLVPLAREGCDPAEERRLLYVSLTRAGRRLYLSSVSRRTLRGQTVEASWSPFLADIPETLLSDYSPLPVRRRPPDRQLDLL